MATRRNPTPLIILIAAAALVLTWFFLKRNQPERVVLSKPTLDLLSRIQEPVEVRFYHSDFTNAFPQRVLTLLRAYESAATGKIALAPLRITNDQGASDAIADGIRPLNLEKGDAVFLGVAMQSGDRKETLPALSMDFTSALEADITRGLERLLASQPVPVEATAPDDADIERVKKTVPNYSELPLDQGTLKLREAMLSDLHKADAELQAKREEMRAAIEKAGATRDQAPQELRQAITQAELEHAEKLKRIVADSQKSIQALQQLKAQR